MSDTEKSFVLLEVRDFGVSACGDRKMAAVICESHAFEMMQKRSERCAHDLFFLRIK